MGHGDGGRAPGSLPHEHVQTFLELVRQVLPDTLSEPESRAIAFGDALTFERVLQADRRVVPSLQHFVEVEGREGRLQLRVLPAAQLDIAVRATKDATHSKLRLGQPFVLELDAEWSAHVLVLQHVQQIWAALPFAATSVSGKIPGGTSVIPADGEGNPLVEDNHVGTHRFVALLAGVRFPADFIAVAQQGLQLDRAALAMLAEFYQKQPPARRAIEVLTVDVRR